MFFTLSKIFWFFVEPSNLLGFALIVGVAGLRTRFAAAAMRVLLFTTIAYLLCAFGPIGAILTRPLEDRFPRPAPDAPAPEGIIVLGGAMDEAVSDARDALVLDVFGTRMTEGVALARRYPNARLIFTGGNGDLVPHTITEAEAARRLFVALGVSEDRIILEDRSRNTNENALFTREVIHPRPDQRFLLVTSGLHMPRSMGVFRQAGFNVVSWPADYRTSGRPTDFWKPNLRAAESMLLVGNATKEWIGLLAYRFAGMTDALLPAP